MVTSSMPAPAAAGLAVDAVDSGAPVVTPEEAAAASDGLPCASLFPPTCTPDALGAPTEAGLTAFWPATAGIPKLGSVPENGGTSDPWSLEPQAHAAQAITMGRAVLLCMTSLFDGWG